LKGTIMDHLFDEFSKSLAEAVPRRESLRRLGAVFAGAVLSPLATGAAWAAGKPAQDPCKAFCQCRNGTQQNACLAACKKCNGNTSRLAGKCGSYVCCPTAACGGVCTDFRSDPNCAVCGNDCRAFGQTCCFVASRGPTEYCADLANEFYNCGGCGVQCAYGEVCVGGLCDCHPSLTRCNGACIDVDSDPDNCGACGDVCPGSAPYCVQGECTCFGTSCGNSCVDLSKDPFNCGACGNVCGPEAKDCVSGVCTAFCDPELTYCEAGGIAACVDLTTDWYNCGACFRQCGVVVGPGSESVCVGGECYAVVPIDY
jgi:hypothetical protein